METFAEFETLIGAFEAEVGEVFLDPNNVRATFALDDYSLLYCGKALRNDSE